MVPSDTQTPRRADQASAEHSARPVQLSELVQRHVVPSAVGGLAYIPNYVSLDQAASFQQSARMRGNIFVCF